MSRFPMPMNPNGWFQVGLSRDLAIGEVKTLRYFGRDLVLYRTEGGAARMMDAKCPHLGAHLGLGEVKGEGIECVMHRWVLDGQSGRPTHIPHAKRIPPKAKATCWPVEERNGIIFVWYHAEGAAPDWHIPEIEGVGLEGDERWLPLRIQHYRIETHCQEIGENVLDAAHLLGVHHQLVPDDRTNSVEEKGHELHVFQHMKMGTGDLAGVEVPVTTRSVGPGVAILSVQVGIVNTLAFINQTPVDDDVLDAWITFTLKRGDDPDMDKGIADIYAGFLNEQYQQDIPVWNTKQYVHRPPLSDADGPVGIWRKWYGQFYSRDWETPYLETLAASA